MKIMIDPGHGGSDPGAVSGEYMEAEKVLNLTASFFLGGVLNSLGHEVSFARVANDAGSGLFVSVHCNSFTDSKPSGFEVYHYLGSEVRKDYASSIRSRVSDLGEIGLHGTGVCASSFYVLKRTRMPAVLLELGFMSNSDDMEKLSDAVFLCLMMRYIGDAIDYSDRRPA